MLSQKGFSSPFLLVFVVLIGLFVAYFSYGYINSPREPTLQNTNLPINEYLKDYNARPSGVPSEDSESTPSTKGDLKVYRSSTNKYEVKYPSRFPPSEENPNSVIFGCNGSEEGYCLPPYYISVLTLGNAKDTNVHNSLTQSTIDKVFVLKTGDELDKATTEEIGGKWNFPTRYKRLDDELINGEKFLVIENPIAYGGSDRRLFINKNNKVYMIGGTYNGDRELNSFKEIYLSFKFIN